MRIISILICFAFLIVNPGIFSAVQKVKTKVTIYGDIFLTESGLLPLPDNAIELDIEFSIPENHFTVAQKIANDSEGNIYVSDKKRSTIFKFNSAGEFLLQIGQKGKRKGSFLSPHKILVEKDSLIIQDKEKKRLEFMNFQGDYLKSLKISGFTDIVNDGKGLLYTAPHVLDKKSPLVKVYSSDGKLLYSFGKPLSFQHSIQALNSRTMTLNEKGELFVAFSYFLLVRKYSSKGD
ncbi:MAG: 6-bladed beta-propeller, partial [Candidatus Aminicenantes bacterium]